MAPETILIIEDDPTILRVLVDNFEYSGFAVTTARDGRTGYEQATGTPPDLIILDIMLPEINGYELCRMIRKAKLSMPIIMLTAKGQESDVVMGLNLGADDYVTKPFSITELLARANAFLRRRRETKKSVYRFGDCELNTVSHKLIRNNAEVPLTPKEYSLLEFFAQHAGRAFIRDDILRHVWGSDVCVTARSVDRCINTLRSKVEPDPRRPIHIQTLRDVGYRFEVGDNHDSVHSDQDHRLPDGLE